MSIFDRFIVTILPFFAVFFIYMSTTVPTNIGVLGSLLLGLFIRSLFISMKVKMIDIKVFFIFFICLAYIYWAVLFRNGVLELQEGFVMRLFMAPLYCVLFFFIFKDNVGLLQKCIRYMLVFCVVAWLLQFVVSYATGTFLDYLDMLGLRKQRGEGYIFKHLHLGFQIWRPTGPFNEPGSYATVVFQLLVLDFFSRKMVLTNLHKITLITLFLSLSAFSMLLATFFLAVYFISRNKNLKTYLLIALFAVIMTIALFYYVQYRFVGNEASSGLEFRTVLLAKWLTQDTIAYLLGNSFEVVNIFTVATGDYDVFVEDLTYLFYLLYHLGVIFLFLYLIFMRTLVKSNLQFIYLSGLLFSKVNITAYFLWVTFISCYLIVRNESKLEGSNK
ncbi:MAG: hypothetical protein ACJAS9_002058 [Polaribacter sp.]